MNFLKSNIDMIIALAILVVVYGKYVYELRKSDGKIFKGNRFSIIIIWVISNIIMGVLFLIFTGINSFITLLLVYVIPTACSDMGFISIRDNKIIGLLYKENISDIESVNVDDWQTKVKFTFNFNNRESRSFRISYNEELIEILKNKNIDVKINKFLVNYK